MVVGDPELVKVPRVVGRVEAVVRRGEGMALRQKPGFLTALQNGRRCLDQRPESLVRQHRVGENVAANERAGRGFSQPRRRQLLSSSFGKESLEISSHFPLY